MFGRRVIVVEPARPSHGRHPGRPRRPPQPLSAASRRKIVVWAHNSHLGDARRHRGCRSRGAHVGQLVRERHAGDCRLIGFTTYTGTVTAADDWGAPAEPEVGTAWRFRTASRSCSTRSARRRFLIAFDRVAEHRRALRSARLERAIGVIYRPETERESHYFRARRGGPVRRGDPHRRHPCGGAARANGALGTGRGA